MQIYFNASAMLILYIISKISRATDLQIYSGNIFHVVSPWLSLVILGYPWLFLVILAYPWLSLVILGYLCLYLVILGYSWLSTIQIYVKSIAHFQLFFPSFAEIFKGNRREPAETTGRAKRKGSQR